MHHQAVRVEAEHVTLQGRRGQDRVARLEDLARRQNTERRGAAAERSL